MSMTAQQCCSQDVYRYALVINPTGLLTKARQQVIWSYLVPFLPWSKIITWIQPRSGPNFQEKDHKEENQSGYLVPPVENLCPGTGKTKGGKYRLQQVKGLGKSWWKVARYTSKVTGLGMARALHWKSIHGTKYS